MKPARLRGGGHLHLGYRFLFTTFYRIAFFTYSVFKERSAENLSSALVGSSGLEPPTSRLSGVRSNHLSYEPIPSHARPVVSLSHFSPSGGDEEVRTPDLLRAKQALSQLSYTPTFFQGPFFQDPQN